MKYYNTFKKAIKNGINAIDLMIATEVDFQLGETLVDVLDNDDEQHNKFEKVCNLTWEVYMKTEGYGIEDIVRTIIEILYDKENTIDTITRDVVIDRLY